MRTSECGIFDAEDNTRYPWLINKLNSVIFANQSRWCSCGFDTITITSLYHIVLHRQNGPCPCPCAARYAERAVLMDFGDVYTLINIYFGRWFWFDIRIHSINARTAPHTHQHCGMLRFESNCRAAVRNSRNSNCHIELDLIISAFQVHLDGKITVPSKYRQRNWNFEWHNA